MLLTSSKWFLLLFLLSTMGEADSWRRRRRRRRSCSASNCLVTSWYSWGPCSNTCGHGTKTRTRAVTRQPYCGGSCPYSLTDSSSCFQYTYYSCQVSQWSSWSTCSNTCGLTGTKRRTRYVTRSASCGRSCLYSLSETRSCIQNLGSSCTLTQWSIWSRCPTICGVLGKQRRHRRVINRPSCGGQCKENLFVSKGCYGDCSMCVMGPWSAWKACSAPCGTKGYKERLTTYTCGSRHPEVKQHAECVGDCCYTKCRKGYVAVGTYPLCHCVQNRWGDSGASRDQGCIACLIVTLIFSTLKIW